MKNKNIPRTGVSIEKVAAKKLQQNINQSINLVHIEVWERIEPGCNIQINKDKINLILRLSIGTNKFIAWITGIFTILVGSVKVLFWLVPILDAYYNKSPPIP